MLRKQYNIDVFNGLGTMLVFNSVKSSEYLTNKTIRSCRLPPFSNGTVRSGGQWGTIHTSPASAVACRRVRNFPHSSSSSSLLSLSLSLSLPDSPRHLVFFILNSYQRQQPVPPPTCRYWLVLSSFSFSVYLDSTRGGAFISPGSGSFRTSGATGVTRPSFPPRSARGMSPGRKSRNSHVWMNKGAESEGTAAGMEENTLPGATCKCLPESWMCVVVKKKERKKEKETLHLCFVIHVLSHVLTARVATMSWGCWLHSCMAHSCCCSKKKEKKKKLAVKKQRERVCVCQGWIMNDPLGGAHADSPHVIKRAQPRLLLLSTRLTPKPQNGFFFVLIWATIKKKKTNKQKNDLLLWWRKQNTGVTISWFLMAWHLIATQCAASSSLRTAQPTGLW